MDEQLKLALVGAGIGYLTGALAIKDPITATLLGAAIGIGVGAVLAGAPTNTIQAAALTPGYTG